MECWRGLITEEMSRHDGETWAEVVACTLTDAELSDLFHIGYGAPQGKPFTLWTTKRVYFPASYDGLEWCASVSRNPDGKETDHIGG